jgi:integrase
LAIRRSKTPAGWRDPSLNDICRRTLADLYALARSINAGEPEHFVFPWHGKEQKLDPTRPITSWRSAWRSILKTAGRQLRFHDLRHGVVTTLGEKGVADWVIMAQVGHISKKMLEHYSHIRRKALNDAAAALEPTPRATSSPRLKWSTS